MPRTSFLQSSFRDGQWANFSQGRTDKRGYGSAMNKCFNYLPLDEGALIRRPGTRFVSTTRDNTSNVKLIPFVTGNNVSRMCELTAGAIRFYSNGTYVTDGDPVEVLTISNDTPAVVTTDTAHGFTTGDGVIFNTDDSLGAIEVLNNQYVITVLSTTTFSIQEVADNTTNVNGNNVCWHGGTVSLIKEDITLPYASADIPNIKYTQDEQFLYLFHPDYETRRIDADSLGITVVSRSDGPYLDQNSTSTTLTPSGTSGSITVTASALAGINDNTGFQTTDVGRLIRIQDANQNWTWLEITARASTTSITATVQGPALADTTARSTWRLGLFSDTTGYPTHGTFHEGRLFLVSDVVTGRIDGSVTFADDNFAPSSADGTVADNSAVSFVVAADGRNRANWITSKERGLIMGTQAGEWVFRASSFDDPITPTSIQARRVTEFGCLDALPILAGRSLVFIQTLRQRLIDHRIISDGDYDGRNIARVGRDLTSVGIVELAYSDEPVPIIWCRRSDGRLVGVSFRNDAETDETGDGIQIGWHEHDVEFTENPISGGLDGNLKSIATVPQSDDGNTFNDTLWMVVRRNGVDCVEYLTPIFDETRIDTQAWFVDSGLGFDASNFGSRWGLVNADTRTFKFYGLHHLEGDTVDVYFRGADLGTGVVDSEGTVTATIPEALFNAPVNASSTTIQSVRITTDELTFSSGFVANTTASDISEPTINGIVPGSAPLIGEDGNRYYIANENQATNTLYVIDMSDGTVQETKTQTQVSADFTAAGLDVIGTLNENGFGFQFQNNLFFGLRGTPYVYVICQASELSDAAWYAVGLYKINGSGTLELLAGFVKHGFTAGSIVPITANVFLHSVALYGAGTLDDQVIAVHESSSAGIPQILRLPGPNAMIQNGFIPPANTGTALTENDAYRDDNLIELTDEYGNLFWRFFNNNTDRPVGNYQNKAFLLPAREASSGDWFMYVCTYFGLAETDIAVNGSPTTSNTYVENTSILYPNGFITAVRIDEAGITGAYSANEPEIFNCRFRDADDNVVVPFSDVGKLADGVTQGDNANDYQNPSVFPTDPDDPTKPWLVIFPRVYTSETDLGSTNSNIGARIFEWDPVEQVARERRERNGSLFDAVADLGVSSGFSSPSSITFERVASTGVLNAIVHYGPDSPIGNQVIISTFGTYNFNEITFQVSDQGFDAVIGLNYKSQGQILRPDAEQEQTIGRTRRVDQASLLLYRTGRISMGTDFADLKLQALTEPGPFGVRPLFTGIHHGALQGSYSFDGQIAWEQDRPDPGTVLAVAGFISTQRR